MNYYYLVFQNDPVNAIPTLVFVSHRKYEAYNFVDRYLHLGYEFEVYRWNQRAVHERQQLIYSKGQWAPKGGTLD